ncbi:DUF2612 domain-containing protein [uncultured Acidaminococcus sp.]|uniref:DUF2612 domain-containing protein n=1 Tax=uncultured Acidaminococcus sp. TaxID=352152 RepID=UPI0025939C3E|nr:DUF2612 domain-containing protein [uncultured Acidaminococcus sp.]
MAGLVGHYLDLITSEHRDKPKYIAMVTALLQPSDDIFALGITIDDEFDVGLAVGKQEDTLGEIVDMDRTLPYQPISAPSAVMDNENYRAMIKAKIAKNMWRGGIEDMEDVWQALFGTRIAIQDNQDMTITVSLNPYSGMLRENLLHELIIPKPQSVRVKYNADYKINRSVRVGMAKRMGLTIPIFPLSMQRDVSSTNPAAVAVAMTISENIDLKGDGNV